MKVSSTHRNARIAPRKVRPLARLLTGMSVQEAQAQLKYLPGRAIRDTLIKVMRSAVANAKHNHGLEAADLTVSQVVVDGGFAFKRFRPASRGMAHPFVKRTAHITVTLQPSSLRGGYGRQARAAAAGKTARKKSDIVTISADQYAAEALDDDPASAKASAGKPQRKAESVQAKTEVDVPKSKEQEAFGKMRGLQSGGDKKKSFRRKSVG